MTTIDEIGRQAGREALADAEVVADADAGLDRLLAEFETEREPRTGGRRWAVLTAVTTVAAAALGLVVVLQDDEPEPATPAATTSAQPSTTAAPTTTVAPSTTLAPSTTAVPTTVPPADDGLGVSYLSPPPMLAPEAFATLTVGEPSSVVVAPDGAVVVVDASAGAAVVVEPDGSTRTVPLDVAPPTLAGAGPGDVVYGLMYGNALPATASIVAIALSGDRAGEVVASRPVDPNTYTELPVGAFGLGPTGVVDRTRQVGAELIGYVDTAGQPVVWPGTPPPLVTIDGDSVRSSNGKSWPLRIERHPNWLGESYVGESPPAGAPDGGATLWTSLGPPANDEDFAPPTVLVVAELEADGTATWHQIPDGWAVAASDVGGAILARRDGDQLQLARLGDTPAPPDDSVAVLAEGIGASTLVTREDGRVLVFSDGTSAEVTTPPDSYVQSDGEFLYWGDGDTSTAATLDGTVVCVVEGSLHRIRAEADGGYVASVEQRDVEFEEGAAISNEAIDCETGERQPIEPISWQVEGGSRFVQREGDRTFTGEGDAEGNADIANETGVDIDGDDYAGYHTFDDDASRVAYLVMDAIATPHLSPLLRARDTTTGELLWSVDLGAPAAGLWWYGDRILAVIPSDLGSMETAAVVVIDAVTGDVVTTLPTTLDIAHVG